MRIDHVALCVRDLEAMRAFYTEYFGAVVGELYHNPRTGLRTYFLTFDGGARVELMQKPGALPREKLKCAQPSRSSTPPGSASGFCISSTRVSPSKVRK